MIVEVVVPMVASMVVSDVFDRIPILGVLGALLLEGGPNQIVWFAAFFFLWVTLTVWCCLVMHGDQRRKEMEQLIKVIEANSGESLHYEAEQKAKQKANKTKMWYLAIIFLISLAILAVFFIKREHQLSNNPKSGVKKLKNPSHKNHKKNNNNHSKHKNNKKAEAKER